MKKCLLVCHFVIYVLQLTAQNNEKKNENELRNGWYITPIQFVFPEINITYEHFIQKRWSLSYALGYKVPVGKPDKENFISDMAIGMHLPMLVASSNEIYTAIMPTYYYNFKRKSKWFPNPNLKIELFNRFYWFNNQAVQDGYPPVHKFYSGNRTEHTNVTGIKLLFGLHDASYSPTRVAKSYYGIGFRYKLFNYKTTNNVNYDNLGVPTAMPDEAKNGSLIDFSVHIGLLLGSMKNK